MGTLKMRGIKILLWISLALLGLDVFTTLINGPLVQHLESNPLYKYFGVAGIVMLNLGLLLFLYYAYEYLSSPGWRYTILAILTVVAVIRGVACWNNFMVFLNPPTLAQAASVTTAQKVATVRRFAWSGILMYVPGVLAFIFFERDHKIKVAK